MKLLIVDDEELTREGLLKTIPWKELGVDRVLTADDGLNGLKLAGLEEPDIVLCDVRMPRMDGIEMLSQIRRILPGTAAIFMSGYSDKEYLKAAIQLKAINYIDKPIDKAELTQTIRTAIEQCNRLKLQACADQSHESQTESQLAYRLTLPWPSNREEIERLTGQLAAHYGAGRFKYFTTLIVKLRMVPEEPDEIRQIMEALNGYLRPMHYRLIFTEKRMYHVVIHIFGEQKPAPSTVDLITEELKKLLLPLGEFYISVGQTVEGQQNVYSSYEQAVILLQDSFFYETGSVLSGQEVDTRIVGSSDRISELVNDFRMAVEIREGDRVPALLSELHDIILGSREFLANQVRNIYSELFWSISSRRGDRRLSTDPAFENRDNVLSIMEECFSYEELHQNLVEKTRNYFEDISSRSAVNPIIRLIREYIAGNYMDPMLSVKSISDYAKLSTSYTCTFFKNETGMTLNQFITEYRIKKAKQLLSDPRNKVSDISASVGYNDGNYFAKSFRKATGLSPTEYREQVVRS